MYPVLGILLALFFGYLIAGRILSGFPLSSGLNIILTTVSTLLLGYFFIRISLFFFKKLKNKWAVGARWQFIAIFIIFAVNGSLAGRLSSPLMRFIGMGAENTSGWLYWPLRLIIIFPIYLISLLIVAWIFGQYKFFYAFEKKMLSRMGLSFLFGGEKK